MAGHPEQRTSGTISAETGKVVEAKAQLQLCYELVWLHTTHQPTHQLNLAISQLSVIRSDHLRSFLILRGNAHQGTIIKCSLSYLQVVRFAHVGTVSDINMDFKTN